MHGTAKNLIKKKKTVVNDPTVLRLHGMLETHFLDLLFWHIRITNIRGKRNKQYVLHLTAVVWRVCDSVQMVVEAGDEIFHILYYVSFVQIVL